MKKKNSIAKKKTTFSTKKTTAMKKCDNQKQNSIDIKTNQTPLKKTNQTPILLKKIFREQHIEKNKNMGRKPLFKENLSLE